MNYDKAQDVVITVLEVIASVLKGIKEVEEFEEEITDFSTSFCLPDY